MALDLRAAWLGTSKRKVTDYVNKGDYVMLYHAEGDDVTETMAVITKVFNKSFHARCKGKGAEEYHADELDGEDEKVQIALEGTSWAKLPGNGPGPVVDEEEFEDFVVEVMEMDSEYYYSVEPDDVDDCEYNVTYWASEHAAMVDAAAV